MPYFPPNTTTLKTAFRGGDIGFVRNHYVIWYDGLPAQYEEGGAYVTTQNLYAVNAGIQVREQIKHPKSGAQSGSIRLIKQMETIAEHEREREIALIENKIKHLRLASPNNVPEAVNLAEQALEQGSLSTAYNWLMHFQTDINSLKNEIQTPQFKDISHMKEFWQVEFSKWLESLFKAEDKDKTSTFTFNLETATIEDIINAYIDHVLASGQRDMIVGIDQIHDSIKTNLSNLLTKLNISTKTSNLFNKTNFSTLARAAAKAKHKAVSKTTKEKISDIASYLGYQVARGMGQELGTAAQASKFGKVEMTGQTRKTLGDHSRVQIKGDIIEYMGAAEGTVDIDVLTEALAGAVANQDWEQYDILRSQLNALLLEINQPLFEVIYNVKGYQSRRDLAIAHISSLNAQTQGLQALADSNAFPALMFDKLIFLLYNTVTGALMDKGK